MAEKDKNPHAGHRKRLRDAYLRGGFEALSDVNRLELLLFYAFRHVYNCTLLCSAVGNADYSVTAPPDCR